MVHHDGQVESSLRLRRICVLHYKAVSVASFSLKVSTSVVGVPLLAAMLLTMLVIATPDQVGRCVHDTVHAAYCGTDLWAE